MRRPPLWGHAAARKGYQSPVCQSVSLISNPQLPVCQSGILSNGCSGSAGWCKSVPNKAPG